jgi:alpha-glucosidase
MPWDGGQGTGFTTGEVWLPLGPDAATRNVAAQAADPSSVLACYRRVIAARRALPSLQDGSLAIVAQPDADVLCFRRRGSGADVVVAIAFGADGGVASLPRPPAGMGWHAVAGSHEDPSQPASGGRRLELRPREAVILVATGVATVPRPVAATRPRRGRCAAGPDR